MNRIMLHSNYWVLAIFALLIGCNSSDKKQMSENEISLRNGALQEQDYGHCDSLNTAGACVNIKVWLPSGADKVSTDILNAINQKVIDRINSYADSASLATRPEALTSAKGAAEVFLTNFGNFKKEMPDAPGYWFIKVDGDTLMVTQKIVMYQLDHAAYTGGAHPNSFRSYHIYDNQTGREVEAKSFVTDSVALLKKAEVEFRKLEKLSPSDDLEKNGYFLPNHQFFLPANYAFTKTGILLYYNPYEIAAYARGPISIEIPYRELNNIVNQEKLF